MKTKIDTKNGITFKVHDVAPATEALEELKLRDTLKRLISVNFQNPNFDDILACSGYNANAVGGIFHHPLVSAVHLSFDEHRPLILSPDIIWVTIVQGLAQHINNNPEHFRDSLVSHAGKKDIIVNVPDIELASPESAWDVGIEKMSAAVAREVGERFSQLESDFSTTGDIERLACQIALLDAYKNYFELILLSGCGIPEITLEGTESDWHKLRAKIELLKQYNLDWWVPELEKIADQFVRAASGDIDLNHWQDIYKLVDMYGASVINGWIVKLIPYLKNDLTGTFTERNPLLGMDGWHIDNFDAGIVSDCLPSGVSSVPFKFLDKESRMHDMEMLGGFTGISQNSDTMELKPILGWAIKKAPQQGQFLDKLAKDCQIEKPLSLKRFNEIVDELTMQGRRAQWPATFLNLYKQCNGIKRDGITIRPMEKLDRFRLSMLEEHRLKLERNNSIDVGSDWVVFADLPCGSQAVLAMEYRSHKVYKVDSHKAEVLCESLEAFIDKYLV